jgi:succinate dehydrogenase hydrophobic anchor subunit
MFGRLRAWAPSVMASTSLALLALLPIQVLSWLIVSDPTEDTAQWVADRWSNSAWRAVDWVFLVVALVHAGLGAMKWLASDRDHLRIRQVGVGFVLAVCLALAVLGTFTMFTYELT